MSGLGGVRHLVAYAAFGALTTAVNVASYWACDALGLSTAVSTIVAWVLAVAFAFLTNKRWVFPGTPWDAMTVRRELTSFVACRLATGALDLAIMVVCVDFIGLPGTPVKLASNVLVIVLNYVASRLVIFRGGAK